MREFARMEAKLDGPNAARKEIAAVSALLALTFAFFPDVVFGLRGFYYLDISNYHFPILRVVREAFTSGEFPYWNRYFSGGQPLAANPEYQLFYPLQWLLAFIDAARAMQIQILLHIALAQIGMYAMLRGSGLRRLSSLFGAIVFGLGAFFLSLTDLLPTLYPTAWMPLALLCARKFMDEPRGRYLAAAAATLAMPLLIGEPVSIARILIVFAGLAVYPAITRDGGLRVVIRRAFLVALIVAAAGLLAAVQVIPAYVHGTMSIRRYALPWNEASGWSFPAPRLFELAFPRMFGDALAMDADYWGRMFYEEARLPFVRCLYFGLLPLILAVAGFAQRRTRLLLATGIAAPLLLALGANFPLYRLFYDAGFLNRVRFPEKFVILSVFTLIVAAAIGFERVIEGDALARRLARRAAVTILVLGALCATFTMTPLLAQMIEAHVRLPRGIMTAVLREVRSSWILAGVDAGLAAILVFTIDRVRARHWAMAALAFTIAELAVISPYAAPRITMRYYDPPEIVREIKASPHARLFAEEFWVRPPEMDAYFAGGVGELRYWSFRNAIIPLLPAAWGIESALDRDIDKTSLLPTAELTVAMETIRASGRRDWARIFMSMSNADGRLVFKPFPGEVRRIARIEDIQPVDLVREGPFPRYYFAESLKSIAGLNDFIRQVGGDEWRPRVAYVPIRAFAPGTGRVLRVNETQNSATLLVDAAARSFLVASVTYDRYWTARVDGRETPLIRTNVAYQGLVVPPGRHTVELRYRNPLIAASGFVSLLTIAALLASAALWKSSSANGSPAHGSNAP